MTESRAQTTEEIVEALEARAAHWKPECNRLLYGSCQTRGCLARGGWKSGDPVDYDLATCEAFVADNTDRLAASRLTALSEELDKARKALEPFAAFLDALEKLGGPSRLKEDDDVFYEIGAHDALRKLTLGDFKAARTAQSPHNDL